MKPGTRRYLGLRLRIPVVSVMGIFQQQPFRDTANSTAFIDLPVSPT
jgi:hypothetical protein